MVFSTIGSAAANPTQVMENGPSALIGLASAIPGKLQKQEPRYGMAMRFMVSIDELNFGRWASCQGLRVDFKPYEVRSGGEYTTLHYLPGEVVYPKIVLRRAVGVEDSSDLHTWLAKHAMLWIEDGAKQNAPGAGDATIQLLNSDNELVMTWLLNEVRPAAWSGPDLDANASKVAIETLELVHEGFQVKVASKGAQPQTQTTPGAPKVRRVTGAGDTSQKFTLTSAADATTKVEFEYKPTSAGISRDTDPAALKTTASGGAEVTSGQANLTLLAFSKLLLVGPGTRRDVEQLIEWAVKDESKKDAKLVDQLPKLNLKWGGITYEVVIKAVSANYTRFDASANPVRAEVTMTLVQNSASPPARQNPTSGGIPGRSSHRMLMAESLPLLAKATYGSSANWRDIAEANDVDDPLRVRAGTKLYLPATSELPVRG